MDLLYSSGYACSALEYASKDEIIYICGNGLVIQSLQNSSQRVIRGTSFGIQGFAVNRKHGLVAVAEKGPNPAIHVYSVHDLQLLGSLHLDFPLGYTCLALSADGERLAVCGEEPHARISVYAWRKAEHIVTADLPQRSGTATSVSFHPYDGDRLAATLNTVGGQGSTHVWHIKRLWDRCEITSKKVLMDLTHPSSTHCWYPGGLYVGTSTGHLYAALVLPPPLPAAPPPAHSTAPSTRAGISRAISTCSDGGSVFLRAGAEGAKDGEEGEEEEKRGDGGDEDSVPQAPEGWDAQLMMDVWGTVGTPITALTVSRDVVVVGGPEEVLWFTHPRVAQGEEGEGGVPSESSEGMGRKWGMKRCGFYEVGLGSGVAALVYGRYEAQGGQVAVGTGDGRVLVLELGDMVTAMEAAEQQRQQQQQQAAQVQEPQPDDESLDSLMRRQEQQEQQQYQQQQQQQDPQVPKHEADTGSTYLGMPPQDVRVLVDSHVGRVAGLVAHSDGSGMVSCGADGTVRLWGLRESRDSKAQSVLSTQLLARRAFSSAQTCLAVAPVTVNSEMALVGVGSETGVLRLLALPSAKKAMAAVDDGGNAHNRTPVRPIQVLWRRRLHQAPLHSIAFSPDGSMLATAGKDNHLWFLSLNRDGTALPLGQIICPGEILCITWPEVHGVDDGVLVSLAAGAIALLRAPIELHAASRPTANEGLMLGPPDVSIHLVRVEAPLLSMVPVAGPQYGEVYGLGADQMVHRVLLPQDNHDWTGLRARPLRSLKRVCVHQRHQSAICAPPNGMLIATGGIDGTLVLLDPALNVLGNLAGGTDATPGSQPHSRGSGLGDGAEVSGNPDTATEEKTVIQEGEAEEEEGRVSGYRGPLVTGIHDVLSQGVAAAAFDTRGRYLVSCGHDGSIFAFQPLTTAHITDQEVSSVGSLTVLDAHDADAFDEDGEAGEVESAAASRPPTNSARQRPGPALGGPPIEKRLRALRDALAECTAKNQSAPDIEKVDRADFIIDRALLRELKAKADAAVKDSRVVAQQEGLIMEVTADRIRAMCWDAMLVRGQHITPIMANNSNDAGGASSTGQASNMPEALHNFPLLEDAKRKRQLAQVSFLRQVEIVEWGDTGAAFEETQPRLNAEGSSRSLVSMPSEAPSPKGPPPGSGTQASRGSSRATGATPDPDHGSEGGLSNRQSTTDLGRSLGRDRWAIQDIDGLMYSSFDLYSPTRKVTQAYFLIQKAQDLKIEFNNEWERLSKQKASDMDKITDLNARLEDVISDLEKLDVPVQQTAEQLKITVSFPEDMTNVLTVVDEEVKDCIKTDVKESSGPQEGGNSMGEGNDASLDRGLRQMMGGTLASKQHKEQTYTLTKPDWMDDNPAFFTAMQQKEVQEFKKKERQLAEERTKRVNMLEVELRTLRSGLEALASQFNSNFKELASRRHIVAADIGAYEVAVLSLAAALEAASEAGEHQELQVQQAMAAANETRTKVAIELSAKRRALTEVEAPLPDLYAQERLLDRNFRKEFADAQQHLGRLLQLYRMRIVAAPHSPLSHRHSAAQSQQHQFQGSGLSPQAASRAASSAQQANNSPGHEGGRQPRTRRHSQTLAGRDSAPQPMQPAIAIADDRPVSPLSVLLHHPLLEDVQGGTSDPWPDLPQPLTTTIISSAQPPGTLPPGAPREPETLGEQYRPEGLDADLWKQFESHRGARVRGEAEVARLEACCSILRDEIQCLEDAAAAATKASAEAMQKIQALQDARQAALLDAELQLRLKAGQLEVGLSSGSKEAGGLLAGTADAMFVHRSVVEALNEQIRQRAVRNVEVLHAIKEFKKNIHLLEWDHKRCDMMLADIAERIRELQLLHVTRDMHAVFREGEAAASGTAAAAAAETSNLEALGKQIEKLHKKATQERLRELKLINMEIMERTNRNAEIGRHLTGLGQVVEEQRRLRASMGSMDDGVRRMRSLVTHKKLKDIALAQADEVRALAAELDHLRQHTYPTFVEPSLAGVADVRVDPQRASLRAPGGSLRGKHLTKSLGRLF